MDLGARGTVNSTLVAGGVENTNTHIHIVVKQKNGMELPFQK